MWFSNSTSDYVVLSSPHSFTIGNTRTFVCDQQIETDADERCLGHGLGVGATPVNFELRGSNMRKDNLSMTHRANQKAASVPTFSRYQLFPIN